MIFANTQRNVALAMIPLMILAYVVYVLVNLRKARPELGNETELAPNRKEYFSDEDLEGPRLDRFLTSALVLLAILAVGLPMYWLAEPGRQTGQIKAFDRTYVKRGKGEFTANCESCHAKGAVGGVAPFVLVDKQGDFNANVSWKAPALNNALLRFSREEVTYVLDHGRTFSPMQPWSTIGGGAKNTQQIQNLVDYLQNVTITPEQARDEVEAGVADMLKTGKASSRGEALFNLEASSGSYSCARCHTAGWSFDQPQASGGGAFGPKLIGVGSKFKDDDQFRQFIAEGCDVGKVYGAVAPDGAQAQCKSGMMPAFGNMYTSDQIKDVVDYVKSLDGTQKYNSKGNAK